MAEATVRMADSDLQRIDRIERALDSLSQNQARLETTVQSLAVGLEKHSQAFEELSQRFIDGTRTNWSNYIAFGSLLLVMTGGAFALMNGYFGLPIKYLEASVRSGVGVEERRFLEVDEAMDDLERQFDGYIADVRSEIDKVDREQRIALSDVTDRMDTVIQREMRLLDEILQREMKLSDEQLSIRIDAVDEKIELRHEAHEKLLQQKSGDRFTGTQGKGLEARIVRLEDKVNGQ